MILSDWVAKRSVKDETEIGRLPINDAFKTDKTFFELLSSPGNEYRMLHLAGYLQVLTDDVLTWSDLFPVMQEIEDLSHDQVLWVDVGGSFGQRTVEFRDKFPALTGRLIVQELPHVSAASPAQAGVEFMAHDFFSEQPVKGRVSTADLLNYSSRILC